VSDIAQRVESFEMADKGTLFFAEVGAGSRPAENVGD
jgi:transcriptional regulator with GAF, ATPase, and Fis domain